ncbi:MAG TPA: hypothetical protein VFM56_13505 [Solimonas sp.]|nr:hypothetical protein [Solimonas sp.]
MNVEQFDRRRHMIGEYLDHIFSQREKLEWVGAKGLDNPKFRNVVAAQERLLNAMEEMLDVVRR